MMEQDRKEYLDKDESEKMCSSKTGEAGEMCSPADTDTCGDCVFAIEKSLILCVWGVRAILRKYGCVFSKMYKNAHGGQFAKRFKLYCITVR